MKQLVRNIKIAIVLILTLALALGAGLIYQQNQSQTTLRAVVGENVASLRERYAHAGTVYTKDGVALAYSKEGERLYADDMELQLSATQLVGDYTHRMSNTIETQYQGELLGNERGIAEQLLLDVSGRGSQGSDVNLTIVSHLNKYAYQGLRDLGLNGAVVLMNYKTGEILSLVSTPTTPVENIVQWTDIPDSALFNRALLGAYAPASTFKVLTAAAWLQSPNFNPELVVSDSAGPLRKNGASDMYGPYGKMNIDSAFAASSNIFFGEATVTMGQKYYSDFLDKLPLHEIDSLGRLRLSEVKFDSSAAAADDALLSWFGTGQPTGDLIISYSPVHMALISAAVANGGNFQHPYVVQNITNPLNKVVASKEETETYRMFSPEIATRLSQLMVSGVESEISSQYAAKIPGVVVGGKSGTLQVGSGETASSNALWTGFLADRNYPFCVAVVVENAKLTNDTAVQLGRNMLEQAMYYGVR